MRISSSRLDALVLNWNKLLSMQERSSGLEWRSLHRSVSVKEQLNQKEKFSIYWSVYVLMMERIKSRTQAAETNRKNVKN